MSVEFYGAWLGYDANGIDPESYMCYLNRTVWVFDLISHGEIVVKRFHFWRLDSEDKIPEAIELLDSYLKIGEALIVRKSTNSDLDHEMMQEMLENIPTNLE